MTSDPAKRPLAAAELDQLAKLEAMRDEDIDFSDIPEITEEQAKELYRPALVMLDAKLVDWFKANSSEVAYLTHINRVLRQYVAKAEKKRA